MPYETLEFALQHGVGRITLNRPDAANAIDLQLARELMEVALRCDEDPEVRAVLLRASGRMFCAGGDLGAFAAAGDAMPALLKEMTTYLHAGISRLARMHAPVIAAVQGAAAGAGFSLACAADLVVASEHAKFTMAYTRAGLTPDGSSTWFLPRIIGQRRTRELMLTNRTLDAAEALEWGLVNEVVSADAVDARAIALAEELAAGPTLAYGVTKKLLMRSPFEGLEAQLEHEGRSIADSARSADAREGIDAFFAKRPAKFRGA